jgi:hypothetical protein
MKTNSTARRIIKARLVGTCLAIVALAVVDLGLYKSMVGRIGQTTGIRSDVAQAPSESISDFMGAFR